VRNYAEVFTTLIEAAIDDVIVQVKAEALEDNTEYIASETIGEVIEKLIILHIRNWHLEDLIEDVSEEELPSLQRKIRFCFKVKRPRLMAALNRMIYELAKGKLELAEDRNIKRYKGVDNGKNNP
jgi:hypothetical protein